MTINQSKKLKDKISLYLKVNDILESRNVFTLLNYNTGKIVHQKQLDFHKNPKRNRWVFGSNRTGKTECGAVETIWMARG